MFDSIKYHLKPDAINQRRYIFWGNRLWQNIYNVISLARQLILRDVETFNNPTVVVIVDRDDLNKQASNSTLIPKDI